MEERPWKIAITHTRYSYTGGVEKYIHSLVERLLDAGHEVHYIAARWEEKEHPRLRFHRVPWVRFPPSLRVWSFNHLVNRILDRHRFDLIHGFTKTDRQDIYTDGSGCVDDYIEATLAHRPRWWRRLYRATPHQRTIRGIEERRFTSPALQRIIPMARFVREQILARYPVDPARIEVVYNGVELEHFHPAHRAGPGADLRRRLGIGAADRAMLFVGNDWRRKGLDVVLRALPHITHESAVPVVLLVAGHDNHPARFERLARDLGVESQIRWLGAVREIRDPFAAADLFVFPSRYDVFGNVGLEALASGVPALLSARAGVSEVLDGGPAGEILRDPEDADDLAACALRLMAPEEAEVRRRAARTLAEGYSWDRHFELILEIYREVIAQRGAASPALAIP